MPFTEMLNSIPIDPAQEIRGVGTFVLPQKVHVGGNVCPLRAIRGDCSMFSNERWHDFLLLLVCIFVALPFISPSTLIDVGVTLAIIVQEESLVLGLTYKWAGRNLLALLLEARNNFNKKLIHHCSFKWNPYKVARPIVFLYFLDSHTTNPHVY